MIAGRNTSANADRAPRVFLSYARSDGEQFAARLRNRLEDEHIPFWQDRIGMQGGRVSNFTLSRRIPFAIFLAEWQTRVDRRCSLKGKEG